MTLAMVVANIFRCTALKWTTVVNGVRSRPNLMECMLSPRHLCSSVASESTLRTILPNRIDNYGGMHFEIADTFPKIAFNPQQFEFLVRREIETKLPSCDKTVRSLWFRVSSHNTHLITPLIQIGFEFHHSKPNYVVLVKPIATDCNIPKYAYTNIGVGALVVDDQMNVLLVKEKHFYVRQVWKLPGGYVEQGEELGVAAEREVREETGVTGRFEGVLLMRHLHRFAFDCADMYFVCLLRPLSTETQKCDNEIEHCRWMPIESIRSHMTPFNRLVINKFLEMRDRRTKVSIGCENLEPYFANMSRYSVYSIRDDQRSTHPASNNAQE